MAGEVRTLKPLPRILTEDPQEFIDNPEILARYFYNLSTQFQNVIETDLTASNGVILDGTDIQHENTSDISDITLINVQVPSTFKFDEFGHMTSFTFRNLTASNGVVIVGKDFQHADTSSIPNATLTGAQVLSTLTFDGFGHPQALTTRDLTPANIGAEPAFAKNTAFNKDFGSNTDEIIEAGGAASNIDELITVADEMIYTTGSDIYATTSLTSFARTLLDDATAAAARSTLGLGTIAVKNTGATGSFTTVDLKTVTVVDGIITAIV